MIYAAVLLTVGAIAFTLLVRAKDLPEPEPTTGYEHLEERKARIYENLRDLQFEYRVGKLSDDDYQRTKLTLQKELAGVMAELEGAHAAAPPSSSMKAEPAKRPDAALTTATECPHCGAKFPIALSFCGRCGKAMV
jgi:hypothetical protein